MTWPILLAAAVIGLAVIWWPRRHGSELDVPEFLRPPVPGAAASPPCAGSPAPGQRPAGTQPPAGVRQPGSHPPHNPHGPALITKSWPCGCQRTWDPFGRLLYALPCGQAADFDTWESEISQ